MRTVRANPGNGEQNMTKTEKITFSLEGEEEQSFYVLEQTRIGGANYILVADCEDGDGEAMILKDLSADGETEGVYMPVEDEEELAAVAGVVESMLDDVEFS